jgi:ankyrin repeat protein
LLAIVLFWAGLVGPAAAQNTQWQQAIARNQVDVLSGMLAAQQRAGAIDARAGDGKTGLMAAAAAGAPDLLKRFLDAGADPAAVNYKGASAVIYGAWNGNVEALQILLDQDVPLEQAASNGWTAMTMAAAKGNVAAIRLLLAAQAQVDPPDVYGWTPLMRASNLGRINAARVLLDEGKASVDWFNASGQTALHVAAAAGHRKLYEMLLSRGASADIADGQGNTAATIAAEQFGE